MQLVLLTSCPAAPPCADPIHSSSSRETPLPVPLLLPGLGYTSALPAPAGAHTPGGFPPRHCAAASAARPAGPPHARAWPGCPGGCPVAGSGNQSSCRPPVVGYTLPAEGKTRADTFYSARKPSHCKRCLAAGSGSELIFPRIALLFLEPLHPDESLMLEDPVARPMDRSPVASVAQSLMRRPTRICRQ